MRAQLPPAFPALCASVGVRKAVQYTTEWSDDVWADYGRWMASFGLVPPTTATVVDSDAIPHQFKWVCAAEGFHTSATALDEQLRLCFQDRSGDVYSGGVVVPPHLHVASDDRGATLRRHTSPVGAVEAARLLAAR